MFLKSILKTGKNLKPKRLDRERISFIEEPDPQLALSITSEEEITSPEVDLLQSPEHGARQSLPGSQDSSAASSVAATPDQRARAIPRLAPVALFTLGPGPYANQSFAIHQGPHGIPVYSAVSDLPRGRRYCRYTLMPNIDLQPISDQQMRTQNGWKFGHR